MISKRIGQSARHCFVVAALAATVAAQASNYVIDTGSGRASGYEPTDGVFLEEDYSGGYDFYFVAARFSLSHFTRITGVEAWMRWFDYDNTGQAGPMSMSIHLADGVGRPYDPDVTGPFTGLPGSWPRLHSLPPDRYRSQR